MNNSPALRDIQQWLQWIITDPRGVSEALSNTHPNMIKYKDRYNEPTPSQLAWIECGKVNVINRLSVYAEGYFFRILECLEKDFSKTRKALGAELFANIVADYLKAYPSKFTSIDEIGYKFASFISEYKEISEEWIADLALCEWSWIEAFYAKSLPVKDADWRKEISSNDDMYFKIHPSVHLIKSNWPLAQIIQTLDADEKFGPQKSYAEKSSGVVIYHNGDNVSWEELDPSLIDVLQSLKIGISLEESLERGQNLDSDAVSKKFSHWVETGILYGVLNNGDEV